MKKKKKINNIEENACGISQNDNLVMLDNKSIVFGAIGIIDDSKFKSIKIHDNNEPIVSENKVLNMYINNINKLNSKSTTNEINKALNQLLTMSINRKDLEQFNDWILKRILVNMKLNESGTREELINKIINNYEQCFHNIIRYEKNSDLSIIQNKISNSPKYETYFGPTGKSSGTFVGCERKLCIGSPTYSQSNNLDLVVRTFKNTDSIGKSFNYFGIGVSPSKLVELYLLHSQENILNINVSEANITKSISLLNREDLSRLNNLATKYFVSQTDWFPTDKSRLQTLIISKLLKPARDLTNVVGEFRNASGTWWPSLFPLCVQHSKKSIFRLPGTKQIITLEGDSVRTPNFLRASGLNSGLNSLFNFNLIDEPNINTPDDSIFLLRNIKGLQFKDILEAIKYIRYLDDEKSDKILYNIIHIRNSFSNLMNHKSSEKALSCNAHIAALKSSDISQNKTPISQLTESEFDYDSDKSCNNTFIQDERSFDRTDVFKVLIDILNDTEIERIYKTYSAKDLNNWNKEWVNAFLKDISETAIRPGLIKLTKAEEKKLKSLIQGLFKIINSETNAFSKYKNASIKWFRDSILDALVGDNNFEAKRLLQKYNTIFLRNEQIRDFNKWVNSKKAYLKYEPLINTEEYPIPTEISKWGEYMKDFILIERFNISETYRTGESLKKIIDDFQKKFYKEDFFTDNTFDIKFECDRDSFFYVSGTFNENRILEYHLDEIGLNQIKEFFSNRTEINYSGPFIEKYEEGADMINVELCGENYKSSVEDEKCVEITPKDFACIEYDSSWSEYDSEVEYYEYNSEDDDSSSSDEDEDD